MIKPRSHSCIILPFAILNPRNLPREMLADRMVQALDSVFTMATESSTGTLAFKRNRTVVVACWVLGVIAVVEVVLAAIALAPRIATGMRPAGQTASVASATTAPSQPPTEEKAEPIPVAQVSRTDSRPQGLTPTPVRDALGENETAPSFRQPQSESRVNDNPSLQILYAKLEATEDGSKVLRVAIKSGMREKIDVPMVKVQVYFYDQDESGEVIPSKAQVTSKWLSAPVDWQEGKPEILEVRYISDSADPGLRFAGYVVAVYYRGDRQDCRSEPPALRKKFDPKYFIGLDES
jgi:hypothetical protein